MVLQYTSLNKMLSNFSKVLILHVSFTAVINNGGIGKGISGIQKAQVKRIKVLNNSRCSRMCRF